MTFLDDRVDVPVWAVLVVCFMSALGLLVPWSWADPVRAVLSFASLALIVRGTVRAVRRRP